MWTDSGGLFGSSRRCWYRAERTRACGFVLLGTREQRFSIRVSPCELGGSPARTVPVAR